MKAVYDAAAPAKLNQFLHVVGRRDDGYHLLQSLFVLIDWADTLHFERRDDGRIARHDLATALPADDLCIRAARLLQQSGGVRWGVDISIDKQLPSGAGMGGGSSDAATTLLVLNRLWQLDWPRERLAALALSLGADVPFFVGGCNAFVEGIGERSTPVELGEQRFVVVKPPDSIDTRRVFASPLLRRDTAAILSGFADEGVGRFTDPAFGRNDLQVAAEALSAQVGEAAGWLQERFGNSRMTGSGSAVFAVAGGIEAEAALAGLPAGWIGRCCRSLARHPLVGWAVVGASR